MKFSLCASVFMKHFETLKMAGLKSDDSILMMGARLVLDLYRWVAVALLHSGCYEKKKKYYRLGILQVTQI